MKPETAMSDLVNSLERSFDFPMSNARRVADQYVSHAIATESARRRRSPRWFVLTRSRGVLVGMLAAVTVAGSVAASGGLFDNLIAGSPVLTDAWQDAHDVNESASDVGYTIVLEKAAIDSERLWVALTLSGAPALADLGEMQVTDANGVVLTAGTGAGTGDVAGESATIFGFAIPDDSELHGPFTLEVKNVFGPDGLVPGRWAFTFDLPTADGG